MSLKQSLTDAMKAAMRAKEKERLAVLDKMCKQRRDSINQYEEAGRTELAEQERFEMAIIQEFMPAPLSDEELDALIDKAIADSGADSVKAMGQVVTLVKPAAQGRADMGSVSRKIKERLSQ